MKALILAAGIGSRLLPHTNEIPKCLLKIGDKSILEYQLDALNKCGINEIIIVIGHKGEGIRKFVKNRNEKFTIIENEIYKTTNSSYSLWLAREHIKEGFIYLNSDLVFDCRLLKKLLKSPYKDAMIVDTKRVLEEDMFKIKLKKGVIRELNKKMDKKIADGQGVGPLKFSEESAHEIINIINELIKKDEKNAWCYSIFDKLSRVKNIYAIEADGLYWKEIDVNADLEEARANEDKIKNN